MNAPWTRVAGPAGAFAVLAGLGWIAARALGLSGSDAWILRGGFMLLGALAAGLVYWYQRSQRAANAQMDEPTSVDPLDPLWVEAAGRLAGSKMGNSARIESTPLFLVVGPAGAGKTTVVLQSGLEAELLAGSVYRGDQVVPTEVLNIWAGGQHVLVEAGGGVQGQPARWARLAKRLRAARLAAAFGRGHQAARLVLVCFSSEDLVSGADLRGPARELRSRLGELAAELGVNLPVYVLFTKADRIPHFPEYVRNLTSQEAAGLLGVTLSRKLLSAGETYAEAEASRIRERLGHVVHVLALRRPDVLKREADGATREGAYEFPRELAKLGDRVADFLVELGRPNQLGVGPFVRGFYFTGVRPVAVDQGAVFDAPAFQAAAPGPAGATMVFNPVQRAASAPAAAGGGRRVPQWTFLPGLFPGVLLADRVAREITAGGTRLNVLRRFLAGSATLLGLVLIVGLSVSWVRNGGVRDAVAEASRDAAGVAVSAGAIPSLGALAELDTLGALMDRLRGYEAEGPPLSMRWGLYDGDAVLAHARSLYFRSFDRIIGRDARSALLTHLSSSLGAGDAAAEYSAVYDDLKAHLVTTDLPVRSEASFLTPVLLERWRAGREIPVETLALVRAQLDRYARELALGNPLPAESDGTLVSRARTTLQNASGEDRFYRGLVDAVSSQTEALDFDQRYRSGQVLRAGAVVPGAFTSDGWLRINSQLDQVGDLLGFEDWVVGGAAQAPGDLDALGTQLRARYVVDYQSTWVSFLEDSQILPFANGEDAFRKLDVLRDAESPLLRLISVASTNAAVDSTLFWEVFSPAHATVPPAAVSLVSDGTRPYLQALGSLAAALEVTAQSGPARERALVDASRAVREARQAVSNLVGNQSINPVAQPVRRAIQRLLEAPLDDADRVLGGLPANELNGQGRDLCTQFRRSVSGYPFERNAPAEASVDEVIGYLHPQGSTFWDFYQEQLAPLIAETGEGPQSVFRARVGAQPQPRADFLRAFNQTASVSRALFPQGASRPRLDVALLLQTSATLPEITVTVGARRLTFDQRSTASQTFTWEPGSGPVRIVGMVDGSPITLVEAEGTWALFRVFSGTSWSEAGGGYRVSWSGLAQPLGGAVQFTVPGVPILRPDFIGGMSCVSQIAR